MAVKCVNERVNTLKNQSWLKKLTPLKILMRGKNYANQRCQQWPQTFRNRTFVDVKGTNNYVFNHTIVKTQKTPSLSISSVT